MRECWQDYIGYARGSNPQLGNQFGYVLPSLVALFLRCLAANAGGTTACNARGRGFESRRSHIRGTV